MKSPLQGGALLAIGTGGVGAVILAIAGITKKDSALVIAAAVAIVLLGISGALGGLIYMATGALRVRNWTGVVVSWALSLLAAVAVFAIATRALLPQLQFQGSATLRVGVLTGWPMGVALVIAMLLFAFIGAYAESGRLGSRPASDLPIALLGWGVFLLLVFSTSGILATSPEAPLSTDSASATRILSAAREEASLNPEAARAQFRLGLALVHLQRYDEAVRPLSEAVRLDPENAHALNSLGWTLNSLGRFEEAVPHLEAAIRLSFEYSDAHHNLGWSLLRLNRFEDAERSYLVAVAQDPENARARSELGWVLHRLDKDSLALVETTRSLELDSDDYWTHLQASRLLRARARFSEARAHVDTAMLLDEQNADVWVQLGELKALASDRAGADSAFTRALQLDSTTYLRNPSSMSIWQAVLRGDTGVVWTRQSGRPSKEKSPR